jgi:DNA primase
MREELNELLERVDLEFFLDFEGIDYKATTGHSGEQFNVRECPVCGASKWKVYLNADTGLGNCFSGSCQATFNKFSFIKAHIGAGGPREVEDHLKSLARELGWRPKRKIEYAVQEETACKLPASIELPTEDGQNLLYLEKRGFDAEIARYFHLRYCHEGFHVYKKPDGTNGVQNFSGRVIIPVYDLDGDLVTYQGRDVTGDSEKKYLFPSALPGTGRFIYNGHNANHARRIVIAEGAFDVAAVKRALDQAEDLRDVVPVGTFGKHLSASSSGNDQYGRFMRLAQTGLQEAVIMWDGEAKVIKDAIKAGELLMRVGIAIRIALLPPGKDPADVDVATVQRCYREAVPLTPRQIVKWRLKPPYRE